MNSALSFHNTIWKWFKNYLGANGRIYLIVWQIEKISVFLNGYAEKVIKFEKMIGENLKKDFIFF